MPRITKALRSVPANNTLARLSFVVITEILSIFWLVVGILDVDRSISLPLSSVVLFALFYVEARYVCHSVQS